MTSDMQEIQIPVDQLEKYKGNIKTRFQKFHELKLVFNNDKKEEINLNDMTTGFSRTIEFPNLYHDIEVKSTDDSIYIFIIEKAPGEACSCCHGSGRKQ